MILRPARKRSAATWGDDISDIFDAKDIGSLVLVTVENDMRKNTQNNYTLSDYVSDFEGTRLELNIALIKMAAKLL